DIPNAYAFALLYYFLGSRIPSRRAVCGEVAALDVVVGQVAWVVVHAQYDQLRARCKKRSCVRERAGCFAAMVPAEQNALADGRYAAHRRNHQDRPARRHDDGLWKRRIDFVDGFPTHLAHDE